MRRIVVSEFISLDGVVEDPGGAEGFAHGGWTFQFNRGDEGDRYKLDEVLDADALLLGRVTYSGFAKAWPSMTGEFADKMNGMPKFVASRTLERAGWGPTTVLRDDVAEGVAEVKQQPGGDLLVAGSASLVQTLVRHDLVDELRLMLFPIVLGSGKRLFDDPGSPKTLRLVGTKPVGPDGVLILTYESNRGEQG